MCVALKGSGGGPQQAISSKVPSVVCRGTVTVWLMDSEWFATGSQELWKKDNSNNKNYLYLYSTFQKQVNKVLCRHKNKQNMFRKC